MKIFTRSWVPALVLALVLSIAMSVSVSAQGATTTQAPGSWSSSVNLQNLQNANTQVDVLFYDGSGTLVFTKSDTLMPNEGKSYYLPAEGGLPDGQYSAVVNSSAEVKAVVNSESTSPNTGYSYNGMDATAVSTDLSFPGLYKNYYGFWSEVVLQNTTANTANVTLNFDNGSNVFPVTATVPGNSSRVFSLGDLASLPSGNSNGLYSLSVTGDQALAGIANIWTAAVHGETLSYNAFVGGATTSYAPALYNDYYNFVSSLTVQNVTNSAVTGTVTYSNGVTENFNLGAGESVEYYQPNNPSLPSGNQNGVFSARITASGDVVTLVNVEDKIQGLAASYNGVTEATTSVFVPVALKEYYGYFSAITVQNVGNSATNITVTFATGDTVTANNVPANGTYNFIQLTSAGDPLPPNTTTSAVVSASQPIVAVVQENNPDRYQQTGGGDFLFAYTASPQ